jgi:hypothetical protein
MHALSQPSGLGCFTGGSGAMTSTSSSSSRSTCHLMEGGGLTIPVGPQSRCQRSRTLRRWCACRQRQASPQPTSEPSSSATAWEKTTVPPLSVGARGTTTSMVTTALQKPLLQGMWRIPLLLQDLEVDAQCLLHTFRWWSSDVNSSLTC